MKEADQRITGGGTGGCITEDVFGIRRMRISGHLLDLNGEEEEP
jgi:hypothetical protein